MADLNLAMIGNCNIGALVNRTGRIVWCCVPRLDGDPVFCSLLNGKDASEDHEDSIGFFDVLLDEFEYSEQHYMENTAVLVTVLSDRNGSAIEITDFAPRFKQFDRNYRPVMLVRHVRPLAGNPRVRLRLRPSSNYGAERPETTHGSNHIRYLTKELTLRLTTDAPVTYVLDETPVVLEEPMTLILGPDESLTRPIANTGREFFERTVAYWREWSRYLSIPFEWQEAVIRAAITLKLCSFEETGAVIAAITTSLPEAPNSERNWDYRFCWLRDAYFVVQALGRLGATRTMEEFLHYLANIAALADGGMQPVYGIALETRLRERTVDSLPGYRGMGPVRVGNHAYTQVQNDVYGSIILASARTFFDRRLPHHGNVMMFERLEAIGEICANRFDKPDAGLWELRGRQRVHTYSSVMCWAGCDRLARIARRLDLPERAANWRKKADQMHKTIWKRAWNRQLNSFVESFDGTHVDASLLQLHEVGFVAPTDPRFIGTVKAVETHLKQGEYLMRYHAPDDFGMPETAFNICTFWYIDALAAIGETERARELFERMLGHRNDAGLLSEDLDIKTGELWGNFPQTYSMVGMINSAMRLSKNWETAF